MSSKIVDSGNYDFVQKHSVASDYRFSEIQQISGGTTQTLSATAATYSTFQLPTEVVNLSRSYLEFTVTLPAQGGGNFGRLWTDVPPIQAFRVIDRGTREPILDLPNFQAYWKQVVLHTTPLQDFQGYGMLGVGATEAAAALTGRCLYGQPSGKNLNTAAAAAAPHTGRIQNDGATVEQSLFRRAMDTACQYVTSADNTALVLKCTLPFDRLAHTFASLDKNFFSPKSLDLEITWMPSDAWGHIGDTAIATLQNQAVFANDPTLTGLKLYMCREHNHILAQQLVDLVLSSGLQMACPFVHSFSISNGTATSASIQQRINVGHGQRLLRVYSSPRLTTNTLASRNNFYNNNGAKHSVFYTSLNSKRLQDYSLSVPAGDDWREQKERLSGSAIMSLPDYHSWSAVWVDDFSACPRLAECRRYDFVWGGIDLTQVPEVTWTKTVSTKSATNTTEEIQVITQRHLEVDRNGVRLM